MRTIIIGDIHGCAAEFRALLARLTPGADDRIIMLGDLFDRGPDSYEVFRMVKQLAGSFGNRFVLLRGNHEDYLLQPRLTLLQKMVWERVGRGATVASFRAHGARMEDTIPWLSEYCAMFWKDEKFQCVHAGLVVDPPEANDTQTLIHDHEVTLRNTYAGPLTVTGHIALDVPRWFAGDGKTVEKLPYGEWRALPEKGVICIDTGCGKGGRLTAMIVDGDRYRLECAQ